MRAADPSSSSTPEAASEVQADSHAAKAGVGEGEGGAGEGQEGSHEVEVAGGSGGGVPVIKPAPVYNKKGEVVEVAQDIVDAVDRFTAPAGFVKSVQVQRLARVPGVVTVCSYPTEITL